LAQEQAVALQRAAVVVLVLELALEQQPV